MKHFPQINIFKIFFSQFFFIWFLKLVSFLLFLLTYSSAQNFYSADPYYLLLNEKAQFQGKFPLVSNTFRPLFFNDDTTSFSATIRSEGYYNDNAPNQENMDVRYFSKGLSGFNSFQITFNSPYFSLMAVWEQPIAPMGRIVSVGHPISRPLRRK